MDSKPGGDAEDIAILRAALLRAEGRDVVMHVRRTTAGTLTVETRLRREVGPTGVDPTAAELEALSRLVAVGHGYSGQCVRARSFLLAWWNAGDNGGFDLFDIANVDTTIARDMAMVFGMIARVRAYPDGNTRLPNLRADMERFRERQSQTRDIAHAANIREDCQRFEVDLDDQISALVWHLERDEPEKAALAAERQGGDE